MGKINSLVCSRWSLIVVLLIASFLRFWKINEVPISLFSDELDVGYQAYSFLETGKDYMGNPLPLYFESYADMRSPVYIYSAVPTVALFGITPLGVRLPAIIFGVLGIWSMYLLVKEIISSQRVGGKVYTYALPLLPALVMTISPWHIQYSRAAFEVTEMLFFLLLGLYFYFKGLRNEKFLWISALCLGLTPWTYSTARVFVPLLILFLFIVWKKEIFLVSKNALIITAVILGIFFIPVVYTTITGTAGQRFSYISIFTDPTTEGEVGSERLIDAQVGGSGRSVVAKVATRLFHNKYIFWSKKIVDNYLETFSTQFLFLKGDLNLRHSPEGIGQFYKVEIVTLILGSVLFFIYFKDRKIKLLFAFWILTGILPSAITRDGGYHATRLILVLPPFIFLISFGIVGILTLSNKYWRKYLALLYLMFLILNFASYLHTYYVHNPWYSERDWHSGYKEVIQSIKEVENNYEKIIITNAQDQPYIFLAAYYPFKPQRWQAGFEEDEIAGFGRLKHMDKFFFGQVGEEGIDSLRDVLDDKTLYVAAQRELGKNLIMDPQFIPEGLRLVKSITYPSGEPAFYFFDKKEI